MVRKEFISPTKGPMCLAFTDILQYVADEPQMDFLIV